MLFKRAVLGIATAVASAWLTVADAHFTDQLWARIPVGATIVHPHDSRAIASNDTHAQHRSLAAMGVDVSSMISKINGFLDKVAGSSMKDLADLGKSLADIDYRVLSPKFTKATSSGDDSLDGLLKDNSAIVQTTSTNIQKLAQSLERAALATAMRDVISAVTSAYGTITAEGGKIRGCGIYKGSFTTYMSQLAGLELPAGEDDKFEALGAAVKAIVTGMATVTTMRQMCDTFGDVDPVTDVKLIFEVLIKAANVKKDNTSGLEDAKTGLKNDDGLFGNRTDSFKDTINEFLSGKTDLYEAAGDLFKSEQWRMSVNGNSAAADASAVFAATLLTRHDQFSGKLTNLEKDVRGNSAIRVSELGKVDAKIDEFHKQKTDQLNTMSKKFGDQHNERSTRLTNIDNRVQGITTQAKAGFQNVQAKLDSLQGNLGRVIDGVADVVKNDAALTTSELKDALRQSFEYTANKIGNIDNRVAAQGEAIQVALDNTKILLNDGFEKTNKVLYAASDKLSAVTAASFQVLRNVVVDAAQKTQDVVSSRVISNGARLSELLVEFDYKIQYVGGRLEVLADQVATLEDRLEVTNEILQDLAASAELVAVGLEELVGDIKELVFQQAFEELRDRYASLRYNYKNALSAPDDFETMNTLKQSCQQSQAHDLLLSFLNLVDIEDEQIPKQMEYFQFEPEKYEVFGMQVITALDELSLLSTLCSGMMFRDFMTEDDLRRKSRENARLIRQAAQQFARHTDEVIPAYMIQVRVQKELEAASTQELGGTPAMRTKTVGELQAKLQRIVGDFARVTVVAAPRDGKLSVKHLDQQYPAVDLSNVRRYGMLVSKNEVLAVLWGNTKQLPASEPVDKDKLLRQGIFRGTVTSGPGCTVAQDAAFYPRCISCVCDHFEDFASNTSATAGRVVTVFNSTAIDSGFVITTVFDAQVDYFVEQLGLQVALDVPTLGAIQASVLSPQRIAQPLMLWEGYADNGKFHVVPSDVKGKLLASNELTLTLNYGGAAFRQVVRLFCNGRPQVVDYAMSLERFPVQFTYQCRENVHTTLNDGTDAIVSRGTPANRMDVAVCIELTDGTTTCRVAGGFDAIGGSIKALRIGRYVRNLTVYVGEKATGDFAICKGCSGDELLRLSGLPAIQSIMFESIDAHELPFRAVVCDKVSDTILACKT